MVARAGSTRSSGCALCQCTILIDSLDTYYTNAGEEPKTNHQKELSEAPSRAQATSQMLRGDAGAESTARKGSALPGTSCCVGLHLALTVLGGGGGGAFVLGGLAGRRATGSCITYFVSSVIGPFHLHGFAFLMPAPLVPAGLLRFVLGAGHLVMTGVANEHGVAGGGTEARVAGSGRLGTVGARLVDAADTPQKSRTARAAAGCFCSMHACWCSASSTSFSLPVRASVAIVASASSATDALCSSDFGAVAVVR